MQESRPDLLRLIRAAGQDPTGWRDVLEAFVAAMRGAQGTFFRSKTTTHHGGTIAVSVGVSDDDLAIYRSRWALEDPWLTRVQLDKVPRGVVVPSQVTCPDEALEQTAIYREFLAPRDWHYGGGVLLLRDDEEVALMSMLRPRGLGPLTDVEVEFWQSLVPELCATLRPEHLR